MFKRFWWIFVVMLPVGALLGLLAAAVVTYVMPKKYESIAVLQIPANPDSSPVDMAAEVALVERSSSLEGTVDALDLTSRWSLPKHEAVNVLKRSLTVTRADGEKRIAIRAEHTSREDARDIAAEVMSIYQKSRSEAALHAKEQAIGMAGKEILDLQAAVEQGKESLKGYVGGLGKGGQDISEVKSRLDADQKLLDEMMKKRVELAAMLTPEVAVVEPPEISNIPCSPQVTQNLVMGTAAGALASILFAAMLIPLLGRK